MADSPSSSPVALLPADCWLLVLEHLSPAEYWPLLLVSKKSSSFIEPLLLRKIAWEWQPIPFRRILLLFRAILQKPERASRIKHLSLLSNQLVNTTDAWCPPSCDSLEELASFDDVLQRSQEIVKTTSFPDTDTWTLALESANPYAFVSVLLSQLHNLETLQLDYSFVWQSGFPGLMLQHALSSSLLPQFDSLTDVDYGSNVRRDRLTCGPPEIFEETGYPQCNPDQFPPWFDLPSLRSLKIWLPSLVWSQRKLPQLQHLVLARTTIPETQVPDILSLMPHLETLHLGMSYRWGKETALQNGSSLIKGLESVRQSLTNLSLGIEYFPPTMPGDVWLQRGEKELSQPFYGLLTQFPNLHSIEMPVNLLAGWSTKPWSNLASGLCDRVEQLCLRADYQTVDENGWQQRHMLDLVACNAERLRSELPRLRTVCVRTWCQFQRGRDLPQKRDAARAACARQGIDFEVVADHVGNGLWT